MSWRTAPQFTDRHSLGGWVVRSPLGRELCHPDILDSHRFLNLGRFLLPAVALDFQSHALVAAVGRPTATVDQRILGQSKDVEDAGFNVFVPTLGEWDLWLFLLAGHFIVQRIGSL